MIKKSKIITLTGGLGNQLFQLAAGLSVCNQWSLQIDWVLGKPRLNNLGFPEVDSFHLPEHITLSDSKKSRMFFAKTAGFYLRQGVEPRKYEKSKGVTYLTRIATGIVLSIYFKKTVFPYSINGVGFTSLRNQIKRNLLIGYFQSCRWMESPSVSAQMCGLKLKEESSEVAEYRNLAETEIPLVVHIRLGDYKGEDAFGIPDIEYYRSAIKDQLQLNQYRKIWAFSDEPDLAEVVLRDFDPEFIRWIPEIANSTAQTFEVMRYGRGYVIANSSFSWWGAALSYNMGAPVIAPTPWFKKMKEPAYLIPAHWTRLPAWNNYLG
jgi:hypothetical protein